MALSSSVTTAPTPFLPCTQPRAFSSVSSISTTSTSLFFKGKRPTSGVGRWTCRKKGIHPEFHDDATVYCNGELVMTTGGTQKEYSVDVWSGNHPFYLGNQAAFMVEDGPLEKFRRKYGENERFMHIPTLLYGEIVLPPKKSKAPGKGGKKK